jgi:UPF0716 protein FxsA
VRWLLAGLLLVPVIEIAVVIAVAQQIGAGATVAALAACSLVGVVLLRRGGRAAVAALGPRVVPAEPGAAAAASGARGADLALGLTGAVLLALPGFVTAAVGAVLAVPPTRRAVRPLLGVATARFVAAMMRRRPGRVVAGETVDTEQPPALPGEIVERPEER